MNKRQLSEKAKSDSELTPVMRVREQADAMYRAASECVRQRERYARLVGSSAGDGELEATRQIVSLCDELLAKSVVDYESAVAKDGAAASETWWHQANALWHASREYGRRNRETDERSRNFGAHSVNKLTELALQYDLEASAVLALSHALAAYRKCCPHAEHAANAPKLAS